MATSERTSLRSVIGALIEVAYPRRCASCGLRGQWVCQECLEATPLFADPRCPVCSLPMPSAICDCRQLPEQVDRLWVAGPYEGWLRSTVRAFKFNGETARASHLAGLLSGACGAMGTDAALAPVPLHPKRKRQRGYDQTALLAVHIGQQTTQQQFWGLVKVRDTPHQVGLSASERSLNLVDAFALRPGVRAPQRVILVDDVATTGATLTECAIALRRGGALWIGAVVIAHGL